MNPKSKKAHDWDEHRFCKKCGCPEWSVRHRMGAGQYTLPCNKKTTEMVQKIAAKVFNEGLKNGSQT